MKRYYKYLFPNFKIFQVHFWFNAHRALMFSVSILSIVAFFLIFADLNWKWVELSDGLIINFVHSIFGIVVISLLFVQVRIFLKISIKLFSLYLIRSKVLMGLLRPEKEHPKRFLFNYAHKTLGICMLVLSSKVKEIKKKQKSINLMQLH